MIRQDRMYANRHRNLNKIIRAAPFLLPGLLLYGTFILLPMLYSFRISFYD